MFFMTIAQLALYEFATIMEFIKEREVFARESSSKNYSVMSYFCAKLTIETPIMLVLPLLENVLTFWFLGYRRTWDAFLKF